MDCGDSFFSLLCHFPAVAFWAFVSGNFLYSPPDLDLSRVRLECEPEKKPIGRRRNQITVSKLIVLDEALLYCRDREYHRGVEK